MLPAAVARAAVAGRHADLGAAAFVLRLVAGRVVPDDAGIDTDGRVRWSTVECRSLLVAADRREITAHLTNGVSPEHGYISLIKLQTDF